ncbi:hypothetical protein H696_00395 [Fonticula alba]|uniref:Kinesin motor domain-containing protein n=1 Tax=Fonticula alba TaxID=691883 RepID=A0A058ZH56_FONAL|nr:hypothetical protein H696_00395 [Fonticula alba]KCV72817.1 hypothetical protein H696_00395 [Fonticula alba]|eukprot:XP_009492518.1 hypothetical protein H696_00395 [Fonticula alba]
MSSIRVAVRCRPFNERERQAHAEPVISVSGQQIAIRNPPGKGGGAPERKFTFDHAYWSGPSGTDASNGGEFAGQEKLFEDLGHEVLRNAMEGYNACIFAYGQTGSGKSYSMMGTDSEPGIVPRICEALFAIMSGTSSLPFLPAVDPASTETVNYKIEVSYIEIYNENVKDLLNPTQAGHNLKVREHPSLGPYVQGLTKFVVSSPEEFYRIMEMGNKTRTVASTLMNATSSRSHAIFSVEFTQLRQCAVSGLSTERTSKISLEGASINKSLSTLGLVIKALVDREARRSAGGNPASIFIPYRDSVLTYLIRDSLGGNSKTIMIAAISPAADSYEETMSTLRYADSAKHIVNQAVVNEDANARIIRELREEIRQLKLAQGGLPPSSASEDAAQIASLRERLLENERLMAEMAMTWEERLAASKRKEAGLLNLKSDGSALRLDTTLHQPHLLNLSDEPQVADGLVLFMIRPGLTVIGSARGMVGISEADLLLGLPEHVTAAHRATSDPATPCPVVPADTLVSVEGASPDAEPQGPEARVHLTLSSGDVRPAHAILFDGGPEGVWLAPACAPSSLPAESLVQVEGVPLPATGPYRLRHGQRIDLGCHVTFRFQHPQEAEALRLHRAGEGPSPYPPAQPGEPGFRRLSGASADSPGLHEGSFTSSTDDGASPVQPSPRMAAEPGADPQIPESVTAVPPSSGPVADSQLSAALRQASHSVAAGGLGDPPAATLVSGAEPPPAVGPSIAAEQQPGSVADSNPVAGQPAPSGAPASEYPDIEISIPRYRLVKDTSSSAVPLPGASGSHHVFTIIIITCDACWRIERRFKQFYELDRHLRKVSCLPDTIAALFPKRYYFGSTSLSVVESRREQLQQYLRAVVDWLTKRPLSPLLRSPRARTLISELPFLAPCGDDDPVVFESGEPGLHFAAQPRGIVPSMVAAEASVSPAFGGGSVGSAFSLGSGGGGNGGPALGQTPQRLATAPQPVQRSALDSRENAPTPTPSPGGGGAGGPAPLSRSSSSSFLLVNGRGTPPRL